MPSGKVRFFDEEKGFGFINGENGEQVYVHASAVNGDGELRPGTRVEYSVADGRRGPQALSVDVLERPRVQRRNRKSADEMAVIVEDLVKLLDGVGNRLKSGQYPERAQSRKVAQMLRHLADDFDV
jgi:CspA family cold shock protein